MKKSFFLAAALLALAACSRSGEIDVPDDDLTLFAYTESPAESRTAVEDKTHVYWEPGDEIAVFSGIKSGKFTTDITSSSPTATFKGTLGEDDWSEGMELWAVYPYSETAVFDDESITTVIPSTQIARAGSFSQGQNVSVARSSDRNLFFRNVLGGVRFTVREANVKSVTLKGNDGEHLAGKVSIRFDHDGIPSIQENFETVSEVTLYAPEDGVFLPDTWYYLSFVPRLYGNGLSITSVLDDGTVVEKILDGPIHIKRGLFGTVRGLGKEMTPEEMVTVLQEGEELLDSDDEKEREKAFERFYEAAEAGSDSSKVYLAYCYEYGIGVDQDMDKAKKLYAEVAASGNQEAQVKVDQLIDGNTNAEIDIPGARPMDLERVVLLCDGCIKTPNGDGTFQADEDRIIASTADERLIYLSFRNPGRTNPKDGLVLDATETAASMLMLSFPFALNSMTDEEFAGMRAMLLSFPETEALISAIRSSVSELGYLDLERISPEVETASAKVRSITNPEIASQIRRRQSPMAPIAVPIRMNSDENTQSNGKPSLSVGSPFYYKGIKIILEEVTPYVSADLWKCKFLIYNYEPIWLSLMPGVKDGNDFIPTGGSFLDNVVEPQNANYIFSMAGVNGLGDMIQAQFSYWRDTILWANGDKDFEDGYWNATETKFTMDIGSEQDVLLIYPATYEDCPQLWVYAQFKTTVLPIMDLFLNVEGEGVETMLANAFLDLAMNPDFIHEAERTIGLSEVGPYLELIWHSCVDLFFNFLNECSDSLFEIAVQPRFKKDVKKWWSYNKVELDKASMEQFKADIDDLKLARDLLKIEELVINIAAWGGRQNLFKKTFFDFTFAGIPMGVTTGEPHGDIYNIVVNVPVTITGGRPVLKRGVVWSLTNNLPTQEDEDCKTAFSSSHDKYFTVGISGVPGGRKSYFRSFITYYDDDLQEQTIYGNVVDFTPTWNMRQFDNEIWYTSTDNQVIVPSDPDAFGGNVIVSNTYVDGQGILTFENPVTVVGVQAFENCETLKTLQLPKTVTEIGKYAFRFCTELERVNIYGELTSCGEQAFACQNLKAFSGPNAKNGRFLVIDGRLVAFARKDMVEVEVPSGITSIGPLVFGGCTNLVSIKIPEGVIRLERAAFINTIKLTSVTLPQSLEAIDEEVFSGCFELANVTIPSGVVSVGLEIFDRCYALREAHFRPIVPPLRAGIFASGLSPDFRIYVPRLSLNAYKTAKNWSVDADIILPEDIAPGGDIEGTDEEPWN